MSLMTISLQLLDF